MPIWRQADRVAKYEAMEGAWAEERAALTAKADNATAQAQEMQRQREKGETGRRGCLSGPATTQAVEPQRGRLEAGRLLNSSSELLV